jgi:hypothetical protein
MLCRCPHCGEQARVPDDALDKAVRCRPCGGVFVVRPKAPPPPPLTHVAPPRPPYAGVKVPPPPHVKARPDTLTDCPACGREVSRRAVACPHCGEPLQPGDTKLVGEPGRVQLIEQTSKPIKLGILLSALTTFAGFVGICASCGGFFSSPGPAHDYGMTASIAVAAVGVTSWAVFEFFAWWHHG